MKFFTYALYVTSILAHSGFCSAQRVIIWDYDGTIVAQNNNTHTAEKPLLPNVETVMNDGEPLNIICSGIRSLQRNTHTIHKNKSYNPHNDIEKFKKLLNTLPIKAVVFSYAVGGTECWILIKTETDFELRTAHKDNRYSHLIGYFQKPDTGMLQVIKDLLSEWHIVIDEILFIGDTLQDQQAAESFAIPFQHAYTIHARNT